MPKSYRSNVRADIIILGSSLPGIVTAYKLKSTLGDSTHILVLDLLDLEYDAKFSPTEAELENIEEEGEINNPEDTDKTNYARKYILRYANDLGVSIPLDIIRPEDTKSKLKKLFQYENGTAAFSDEDFHKFSYLSYREKSELNKFQTEIDYNMKDLFEIDPSKNTAEERKKLMYYDKTSMETHICTKLSSENSRNIMRNTVYIVCGAPAQLVSLLFYLHQCYRNSSCMNILDNDNVRIREKLIGYCLNKLSDKLLERVADILIPSKPVTGIRSYSNKQFLLETHRGENYICDMLAMAVSPEQLRSIEVETELLSEKNMSVAKSLESFRSKKFNIQYKTNFWMNQGFSGEILSVKGPIIWAMEKPQISNTDEIDRMASLEGFLKVKYEDLDDLGESKGKVIEQLIKLFGPEAANPTSYTEKDIRDMFIPRFGDFVALRSLLEEEGNIYWGTLNIFQEGDLASAIEAGHTVFLKILSIIRPQAQNFDDFINHNPPVFPKTSISSVLGSVCYFSVSLVLFTGIIVAGFQFLTRSR